MQQYSNIDRIDAQAQNTKYPFAWQSTLSANGILLPSGAFKCIILHMGQTKTPPAHMARIALDGEDVVITFADFNSVTVGTLRMTEGASFDFIRDTDNVIVGHSVWLSSAYVFFLDCIRLSGASLTLNPGDFLLLPECHKAVLEGNGKVLYVGDTAVTDSVILDTDGNAVFRREDGAFVLHLFGNPPDISVSAGIQEVNGVVAGGRHMLLTHAALSNVRVTVEGGQVQFKGVLDVD